MRRLGLFLCVLGIVAVVIATASGCGAFFSYSGRHPVSVVPLVPGAPVRQTFPARHRVRYTLAVHVIFERDGLAMSNGALVVQAQFPLVASVEDNSGVAIAKAVGFLDPNEPPTVLYGAGSDPNERRPAGTAPRELVAERLIGSVTVPFDRDVAFAVDLQPDILGKATLKEARIVVYDDALPTSITVAFFGAVAGGVSLVIGAIMLFLGLFRARRGGARRRQIV